MLKQQSFISEENLEVISGYADFKELVDSKRKNNDFLLENIDASQIEEIGNMDFSDFTIRNFIFGRFNPEVKGKRTLFNLNFKNATLENVAFVQCDLIQCNFDHGSGSGAHWDRVDFFYSDLMSCRFRHTDMNIADFRYSHISDCSMSGMKLNLGDFYMAAFQGTTNFRDAVFTACSFTHSSFDFHCIEMSNIPSGIVQENYEDYKVMVESAWWHKYNPCGEKSKLNEGEDPLEQEAYIYKEASWMYSVLSGIYSGKGLHNDSNKAYKKSKQNLKRHYLLRLRIDLRSRSFGKAFADFKELVRYFVIWLFGFGYEWGRVACLFLAVVLGYAVVYFAKCPGADGTFMEAFAYSLNNSLSPYEKLVDIVKDMPGSIETTIGILLLGFIGFIFANKIRNNS